MKLNRINDGYRNLQAVSVLNEVDYDSVGNPIGLKEGLDNNTSANFGVERTPRRGGCYEGDDNAYVIIPSTTFDGSYFEVVLTVDLNVPSVGNSYIFTLNYDSTTSNGLFFQQTAAGVFRVYFAETATAIEVPTEQAITGKPIIYRLVYNGSLYSIYVDGILFVGTNIAAAPSNLGDSYIGSVNTTNNLSDGHKIHSVQVNKLDSNLNFVSHYSFYKLSENSGDLAYDSSSNGNHGAIINAITVPNDPNSIFQSQDIYSFENEVGFTLSDGISYYSDAAATQLIPVGVIIPRLEANE